MSKPLFTIAIPTFNRIEFLKQSLPAALLQSYDAIQVLVCDNASNDGTEQYVRSIDDPRIKYHRNPQNVGAQKNFRIAADLADGEYFSWLQDDDLIVPDFAARAVECLEKHQASLYLGSAFHNESADSMYWPGVYSPPITMGWLTGKETLVDAETILGLSLLISVAIPPVIAFKTEVLRAHAKSLSNLDFPLYVERTWLCEVALQGITVADPKLCGLFRRHKEQMSQHMLADGKRARAEWLSMANYLERIYSERPSGDLLQTRACFESIPISILKSWIEESEHWPQGHSLATGIRRLMQDVALNRGVAIQGRFARYGKKVLRSCIPPFLLNALVRFSNGFAVAQPSKR